MITFFWILAFFVGIGILAYHRASLPVWTLGFIAFLLCFSFLSPFSFTLKLVLWTIFLALALLLNLKPLRRHLLSSLIFAKFKGKVPKLSKTEREALEAGTVNWAGELFGGMPDWNTFIKQKGYVLSPEEQAFLDGPVETLCRQIDDWDITHNRADMPPEMWQFLKEHGFFGMIIPKEYGGLDFSAAAHSAVLVKVSAFSITVATTIGVPNSLGPAELLLKYGTPDQKAYYLPRLARGEEIPCFALTGPEAGSDASSIPDMGVVCRSEFNGESTLGIRLTFDKRYITLAPVATVIGLAFQLFDPDHLIGDKEVLGITCALIPREIPGIHIGRRHFPLNHVFQNGPVSGKDIFIPLDWIIGGGGYGWTRMANAHGMFIGR